MLGSVAACLVLVGGCGSSSGFKADAGDGSAADKSAAGTGGVKTDAGAGTGGGSGGHADAAPATDGAGGGDAGGPDASGVGGSGDGGGSGGKDGGGDVVPPAPTCSDGIKNGNETDIDCGGSCPQCGPGLSCHMGLDCQFGTCIAANDTCGACNVATDCPGAETECQHRTCNGGICGTTFVATGTALQVQTSGDCMRRQCGASGAITAANDDTDVPDDGNPCTVDVCTMGVPSHTMVAVNTSCGGDNFCDAGGQCIGCMAASDCPGTDGVCGTRTCSATGVCGFNLQPAGTKLTDPTAGDCKDMECDGQGNAVVANDDNDVPNDGNPCTVDKCSAGTPSHQSAPVGTGCNQNGGTVCNATGMCIQCSSDADCSHTGDTACNKNRCVTGACVLTAEPANEAVADVSPGNCQANICNGAGGISSVENDQDLPTSANDCVVAGCSGGNVTTTNHPHGTTCASSGGRTCDGQGSCLLTFSVMRVGTGVAALSSASTAVFIEERQLSGALVGTAVALPVAPGATGVNAIGISGTASSEGALSLSGNGRVLTMAGYNLAAGTSGSAKSSAASRMVARIDASGNVDTTTLLGSGPFTGDNVRSATSNDGSAFWVGGAGNTGSGGIWYVVLGATTAPVHLFSTTDVRWLEVFGTQLYGSSNNSPNANVFTVGSGLPTTGTQTLSSFSGMTITGASPFAFVILDRNATSPGIDTLYVADDGTATQGVQKWTSADAGATWTKAATFNLSTATGFRGLAGLVTGANVTLMATTSDAAANRLVVVVDDGTALSTASVVATSATNTRYLGVALAPHL